MTSSGADRPLSAVLSVELACYDGRSTPDPSDDARVPKEFHEIVLAAASSHSGMRLAGPARVIFMEFASPLDAVRCALEIQRATDAKSAEVPLQQAPIVRVGVHSAVPGGPEGTQNELVLTAACISGLAPPAGICISGATHEHVRSALAVLFEDLGERSLEDLPQPLRVWRIQDREPTRAAVPGRRRSRAWVAPALLVVGVAAAALIPWARSLPPPRPHTATSLARLAEREALDWLHGRDGAGELAAAALETAERAVALEPSSARAHQARSMTLLYGRALEEAVAAARHAVALDPGDPQIQGTLARALVYSGHVYEGIGLLERALRLDPVDADLQVALGLGYRQLGRRDDAIAAYERALANSTAHVEASVHVAVLYSESGQASRLESVLQALAESHPEFDARAYAARLPFADPLDNERLSQGLRAIGL